MVEMSSTGTLNVENLISYSDDLVTVLRDKKDADNLKHCLNQTESLQTSCDADFRQVHQLLQDYQRRIETCKQKTEVAKSEIATDEEMNLLLKELEKELEKERLLKEELRIISTEIKDLECQRISIGDRKHALRKLEQDDMMAQRKLSMYASVTNIIPNITDQCKVSGHIVDRDKKMVQKFEFDPTKKSAFNMCNDLWRMIDFN